MKKEIQHEKVFYQRNVDLGIDPHCHECISHRGGKDGYPQIYRSGQKFRIHRLLYIQATEETPEVVMHLCDNKKCINLNHLKAGTFFENNIDRVNKSRQGNNSGEKAGNAKLTEWDVRFIRGWYKEGYNTSKLSDVFKVTSQCIRDIVSYKKWKEVV